MSTLLFALLRHAKVSPANATSPITMKTSSSLVITNRGPAIESTNYFDSPAAREGRIFLSWNAGAGRILVPDSEQAVLSEMRTGKCVIISAGPWPEHGGRVGVELLFEDETDYPFAIQISAGQTDRILPASDHGARFDVSVWTRDGEAFRLPGRYRRVSEIPCLAPWSSERPH